VRQWTVFINDNASRQPAFAERRRALRIAQVMEPEPAALRPPPRDPAGSGQTSLPELSSNFLGISCKRLIRRESNRRLSGL
jgi:hypothetical protein